MKPETLILKCLKLHQISFWSQDNVFNPALEVAFPDFSRAMELFKGELSFISLLSIAACHGPKGSGAEGKKSGGEKIWPVIIYYLLHRESHRRLQIKVQCPESGEMPSICQLWDHAEWYEREVFDFWGVRFGHQCTRLILPENFVGHPQREPCSEQGDRLDWQERSFPSKFNAAIKKSLALGNFNSSEFPENGYVENNFRLNGVKIVEAKIILGFEHRGIEQCCEGKTCVEVLPLIECVNPRQAPLLSQLWCCLVEDVFELVATERSQALRMLISELVRILDHVKNFSMMLRLLRGHGYGRVLRSLSLEIHQLIEAIGFNGGEFRFSCPGGMLGDIPLDWRSRCLDILSLLGRELADWEKVMLGSVTIKEKLLRDTVSGELALELGLSGPALRACGINYDMRKTNPYYFYHQVDFETPLGLYGSSYDRLLVRLEEVRQSMRIIYQLLDNLPMGDNLNQSLLDSLGASDLSAAWSSFLQKRSPVAREIYCAQEGPSGEVGYYLQMMDDSPLVRCLKIHTPAFNHARAFEKIVVGFSVDDYPLIQASLNFSLGEVER